ncbi:MAG TPA: hypothetical protein PL124_03495 [Candidatus Cloacimonadota bacterium]|nr:hypothetical protein [Candidatus Cloacimonadota bacterium]HPS38458.1 hypothetical protein [Candidatus Cloacimonadota bacterium]
MNRKIISEYNAICEKCMRKCKQRKDVHLLSCPRYNPKPVQLEIKFVFPKSKRSKPSA